MEEKWTIIGGVVNCKGQKQLQNLNPKPSLSLQLHFGEYGTCSGTFILMQTMQLSCMSRKYLCKSGILDIVVENNHVNWDNCLNSISSHFKSNANHCESQGLQITYVPYLWRNLK